MAVALDVKTDCFSCECVAYRKFYSSTHSLASPLVIFTCRECVIGNCPSTVENTPHRKDSHAQNVNEDLSSCLNTSIQTRSYPPCEVFKTGSCGYGLKVGSDVSACTLLIEYTGEVITASECSDRMRGMKGS
jgi:hypothetical protein